MNHYERAIKALNDAHECESGHDAVNVIRGAMQDARDHAFEEAARIAREEGGEHEGCDPCDACRIAKRLLARKGSVAR